ncbi:hypothetical protein MF271_19965 (plasmid) [Deinococcus sp. KNUC1210]|uniref:hypothetical protein n=1 Tax=Deinococcus sp. KNUC1210 TaxID=2917691 RepID=UPI001EF06182|nr:hypothetical protein [Deinococcus sp. KNUC1210]ULH17691.1 hypothetical protein MF271_19965 [Deinococcus sp. KNUC1210]
MNTFRVAALLTLVIAGSVASAATTVTSTTTRTTTVTRAQMHTANNLARYSRVTTNNLSRYSRAACAKHKGVMIKQKSNGKLVCVVKLR